MGQCSPNPHRVVPTSGDDATTVGDPRERHDVQEGVGVHGGETDRVTSVFGFPDNQGVVF